MSNPEELETVELAEELELQLAASLSLEAPAPSEDYWSSIESTLIAIEAADTDEDDLVAVGPGLAAMGQQKSGLTKALFGTAAGLMLLALGGVWLFQSDGFLTGDEDTTESAVAAGQAEVFEEVARQAEAESFIADNSATEAAEESSDESFDDFAADLEESTEAKDLALSLEEFDWFNAINSSKNLVSDETFNKVRVSSADGLLELNDYAIYRFSTDEGVTGRVVLASTGLAAKATVYDPTGEELAADIDFVDFETTQPGEHYLVIDIADPTDLEGTSEPIEFGLSLQLN